MCFLNSVTLSGLCPLWCSLHSGCVLTCGAHFTPPVTSCFPHGLKHPQIYKCARCPVCGKVLKPDLVFFGEALPSEPMRHAKLAFLNADLVLILGTSLRVSPANSLPGLRVDGTPMIIINQDPTPYDEYADFVSHKKIGEILPKLIGEG